MAATHNTRANCSSLKYTNLPPGKPGEPYVSSFQEGEVIYIPLSKSATRLLVTGKETENAFALVGSSGSQSEPIGFHYHRHAHDIFLCLKGHVNVWAGNKCRMLEAGDFASVPPGTIHQYQILGNHSEMVGLIMPGGWEEFFRFIGEPYAGPFWPIDDKRNFFEVLLPKLKAAAEQFDMVPCPQTESFSPSLWQEDDNKLAGAFEPYFLKSGTGPAYLAGGLLCRPLITTTESNGKFAISSIEGSSHHNKSSLFAQCRRIKFDSTHHVFQLAEGVVEFELDSSRPAFLHAGELIYVPSATHFSINIHSRYAKFYAFSSGHGITQLLSAVGRSWDASIPPENVEDPDLDRIKGQEKILRFQWQ